MQTYRAVDNNPDIIWKGKPVLKVWFSKADIFLIPWSMLFGLIIFLWEISTINFYIQRSDVIYVFLSVFGLLFCTIAIYQLIGRYYWKYRKKASEYYTISKESIYIYSKREVNCLQLKSPLQVKLKDITRKGVGTIVIGKEFPVAIIFSNTGFESESWLKKRQIFVLRDIPNAKMVYDAIKQNII